MLAKCDNIESSRTTTKRTLRKDCFVDCCFESQEWTLKLTIVLLLCYFSLFSMCPIKALWITVPFVKSFTEIKLPCLVMAVTEKKIKRRQHVQYMTEKTIWPTSMLPLLRRSLQMELSQHTDPNPGWHTYTITTTSNHHWHTIFSLVWRTEHKWVEKTNKATLFKNKKRR